MTRCEITGWPRGHTRVGRSPRFWRRWHSSLFPFPVRFVGRLRLPPFPGHRLPGPADARPLTIDSGAAGLWQTLLKLHTRASLLMVTAHPDDEDGGMLAYETRGQGARAALMTLNRGEGGQNVMSDDF